MTFSVPLLVAESSRTQRIAVRCHIEVTDRVDTLRQSVRREQTESANRRALHDVTVEHGLATIRGGHANRIVTPRAHVFGKRIGNAVGAVHARTIADVFFHLGNHDQHFGFGRRERWCTRYRGCWCCRNHAARRRGRRGIIGSFRSPLRCRRRHLVDGPRLAVIHRREMAVPTGHAAEYQAHARAIARRHAAFVVARREPDLAPARRTLEPKRIGHGAERITRFCGAARAGQSVEGSRTVRHLRPRCIRRYRCRADRSNNWLEQYRR